MSVDNIIKENKEKEISLIETIEIQNQKFLNNISSKYYNKGKKLITEYDFKNSLINIPFEYRYDNKKLIPYLDNFIYKRSIFLEELLKVLS